MPTVCLTSTSHISRLPLEILILIFQYCRPLASYKLTYDYPSNPSNYLTKLRLVCAEWNTIITQTASFWTTLSIFHPDERYLESPPATVLSLWLRRSASLPLDIYYLWISNDYPQTGPEGLPDVFDVLRHSISRWRTFVFCVEDDATDLLTYFPLSNAHSLQNLSFNNSHQELTVKIIKYIASSPNLRSITLPLILPPIARAMSRYMVNVLNNLTKFDLLFKAAWVDVWEVCRQCRLATEIDLQLFSYVTDNVTDDFPSSPVTFPNLIKFELDTQPTLQLTTLIHLTSFRAPNLQFLYLRIQFTPGSPLIERLSEYIRDVGHSLYFFRLIRIDDINDVKKFFLGPGIRKIPFVEVIVSEEDYEKLKAITRTWVDEVGREVRVARRIDFPKILGVGWHDHSVSPPTPLENSRAGP